jgi:predicted transposase/invertase (TIGR01784 family)
VTNSGGDDQVVDKPHDALFRWTFSDPERARAELAAVLPPALAAGVDWPTLELVSVGSTDRMLKRFDVDLLYSVRLGTKPAFFYLLFEHQSSVDALMPLRLLGYLTRTLEWYARKKGSGKAALPLPLVIPLVLYHGESGWSAATEFEALFDSELLADPAVAALVPHFRFVLDDLSRLSDAELERRGLDLVAALTLWALRDSRRSLGRLRGSFANWGSALDDLNLQGYPGEEALRRIFGYILQVNHELTPEALRELLGRLKPETQESIMTLAQQFKAEGRAEGRAEGERQLLLRQLALKFGPLPDAVRQRIDAATEDDLLAWSERVLTARALEDVLGG